MIAQVGMAVNRVAAMPITLREIAMGAKAKPTATATAFCIYIIPS